MFCLGSPTSSNTKLYLRQWFYYNFCPKTPPSSRKKNEATLQDRIHHYIFSISWKSGSQVRKNLRHSLTLGLQPLENILSIFSASTLINKCYNKFTWTIAHWKPIHLPWLSVTVSEKTWHRRIFPPNIYPRVTKNILRYSVIPVHTCKPASWAADFPLRQRMTATNAFKSSRERVLT